MCVCRACVRVRVSVISTFCIISDLVLCSCVITVHHSCLLLHENSLKILLLVVMVIMLMLLYFFVCVFESQRLLLDIDVLRNVDFYFKSFCFNTYFVFRETCLFTPVSEKYRLHI